MTGGLHIYHASHPEGAEVCGAVWNEPLRGRSRAQCLAAGGGVGRPAACKGHSVNRGKASNTAYRLDPGAVTRYDPCVPSNGETEEQFVCTGGTNEDDA
jgi:hypothetical protein